MILKITATLIAAIFYIRAQRAKARRAGKCLTCNTSTTGAYRPKCRTKIPSP